MRAYVIITGALLCLGLASATGAQTVEQQVRAEVGRYVNAVNSGQPRAVAALYLEDRATTTVGDGTIFRGPQQVSEVIRDAYRQAGTIRMTTDSVMVRRLGNDAAIAVMRYRWTLGRAEDRSITGAMTLVYTRTRRGWRIVHDHTSTLETAGSVAASLAVTDSGPTEARRQTQSCTITRIVDGDTINCSGIGRVRLIGMDSPESNQPPFGAQASAALAALIPVGTEVQLEPDIDRRDRSGRLLAYVWRGRMMTNWQMVREGWAVLLTYQPNVQYVDWFIDAERRAREENRGLWATGGFDCRPADRRRNRCD